MQTTRYLRARHSLPVESPDILHNGHRYRHVPFLPERRPAATGRIKTDWQLGNIQAAAPMPLTSPGNDDDTGENHQPTLRKNTAEPVEQTLKQNTGGSRDRPLMVLLAWAMCLVRRMDRGLSGWPTMTVRPYMVLRVGRMIGPACGPLVHSHDVDRKRAGHVGGPPASTWSIWPLVQGPGLRPWPTRRGLIVDRAVLDGPWSWLTPSSASDRPVRPTADTRRLRQDLFILRVAPR